MDLLKIRQRAKEAKEKLKAEAASPPTPPTPAPSTPPLSKVAPERPKNVSDPLLDDDAPPNRVKQPTPSRTPSTMSAPRPPRGTDAPPRGTGATPSPAPQNTERPAPRRSETTAARRAPAEATRQKSSAQLNAPADAPPASAAKREESVKVRAPSTSFRAASLVEDRSQTGERPEKGKTSRTTSATEAIPNVFSGAHAAAAPFETAMPTAQNEDPLKEFLVRYDDVGEGSTLPKTEGELDKDIYRRFLAFELEDEEYAISIMDVREILSVVSVTPVPRAPAFILGVFSKRGVVMPILDLAAVLKLRAPSSRMQRSSRVLVVGDQDHVCGLRVDALHDAVRLREEDIEPVPSGLETKTAMLLDGLGRIGDRMLILLDGEALLSALRQATNERATEAREAS